MKKLIIIILAIIAVIIIAGAWISYSNPNFKGCKWEGINCVDEENWSMILK